MSSFLQTHPSTVITVHLPTSVCYRQRVDIHVRLFLKKSRVILELQCLIIIKSPHNIAFTQTKQRNNGEKKDTIMECGAIQ